MTSKDVETRFIEKMGFAAEQDRLPRIAGRMLGLLLLEEQPLSLDDLAKRLQVSKASISTNARLLDAMGVIERVTRPGDRRDHFQVAPDSGRELLRTTAKLMHDRSRMLGATKQALGDMPVAKKRLAQYEKFYRSVGRGIERALLEIEGG